MRIFIAVNLPPNIVDGLKQRRQRLDEFAGHLRLVDPTGLHVTLCFVGEVPAQEAEVIEFGVRKLTVSEGPFVLALAQGGSFPADDDARIVWVAVDGELRRLADLQDKIAREVRSLGYRVDKRPFSPHVTLARVARDASREDRRRIANAASEIDCLGLGSFEVRTVDVMESFLSANGASYAPVALIPLQPAPNA